MKIRILLFLGFVLLNHLNAFSDKLTDSLLVKLDKAIENKSRYQDAKIQKIGTLSLLLQKSPHLSYSARNDIYTELYKEYRSFNYDSAFTYSLRLLNNAYASKNQLLVDKSKIKVCFTLLSAGLFKETFDTLNSVAVSQLPDSVQLEYYQLLGRTYFDMADFINDQYYRAKYNESACQMLTKALGLCREGTDVHQSISALLCLRRGDIKNARRIYESLLKSKKLDGHQYAIEASSLGFIYQRDHEPELALRVMINAAIADIEVSTKETVALRDISKFIYQAGDIDRAYRYVKIALEDAYFYGARHRKVQLSDILPSIEDRYLEIVLHQRRTFLIYSLSLTVLSLLTILFGVIIFRQLKKLRKAKKYLSHANDRLSEINSRLVEANMIKEEYIAYFFDSISDYINKLEKLKTNIGRKITTRQIDDIKDLVSGVDTKKEREKFYTSFDSIFLKIFPDFIPMFNSFLKEESAFTDTQMLTPEVRIYALIRLGFAENDKIAKFLGYSLNTIYAYKTKIKNKLNISVEEFDKKLMKIGSVQA